MSKRVKITPELIKGVKALYDGIPGKRNRAKTLAEVFGISTFTIRAIINGDFTMEGYQAVTRGYYESAKKKAGKLTKKERAKMEKMGEIRTNYLYQDKLVEQMGELVMAVRDLVDAWNARPEKVEKTEKLAVDTDQPKKLKADSDQPTKTDWF